jgi:hypothetical protein
VAPFAEPLASARPPIVGVPSGSVPFGDIPFGDVPSEDVPWSGVPLSGAGADGGADTRRDDRRRSVVGILLQLRLTCSDCSGFHLWSPLGRGDRGVRGRRRPGVPGSRCNGTARRWSARPRQMRAGAWCGALENKSTTFRRVLCTRPRNRAAGRIR